MPQDEESSIERLKRTLYSRNEDVVPKEKRTPVAGREIDAPIDWGAPKSFALSPEEMKRKNNSFFNKFLLGSLGFFFISLCIALFIFFGGLNTISSNNLDVKIVAPTSVSSGEELDMGITVINGNRTNLEGVSLSIQYPSGAESVDQNNKILTRDKIDLGTINNGQASEYTVRVLLFGEKDAIKTFTFTIQYTIKGSNAVFSKEKTYDVVIGSSPILLDVSSPKEINSGQTVKIFVDVTSNSSVPLKDTLIRVDYPYGFTYKDSNIKPLRTNSIWDIGDLKNGDKKTLTISGVLVGQNEEDRSFVISAGTQSQDNAKDFDTTLAASTITIGIRKSFFDLSVGSNEVSSAKVAQIVPVEIKWQNTLPDKILNNHIEATISGNAFDRSKVSVSDGGFFQSVNNVILWDKNSTADLATFSPGDVGQVSFSVASISNLTQGTIVKNPHIDVHVNMTGDRSGSNAENISSSQDYSIKINSILGLSNRSLRDNGTFNNTGPVPPKADTETTYTINWVLTNSTNDLNDVTVSTTLPAGVEWKGEISPSSERVSYSPDTRTVTWSIGSISYGIGYIYSPKQVYFKVGLTPSVNQVGSSPFLTSEVDSTAIDTYTQKPISVSVGGVSTKYSDPTFIFGRDIVVK